MLLTLIWCAVACATSALFLFKVVLFVSTTAGAAWLCAVAVFVLLYILFLAEGLQVAALYIKEHSLETIDRYVQDRGDPDAKHISYMAEQFIHCFDAFITGRQIIVIISVISFATLLNAMEIDKLALHGSFSLVVTWIESPYFAFMFSILLPAWFSQLLPQFAANNRALSFIKLPWACSIVKITLILDKIGAGLPARKMLNVLQYAGAFNDKQSLVIEHQNHHAHLVQFDHQHLTWRKAVESFSTHGTRFEESFELKLSSSMPDSLRFKLGYKGVAGIKLNFLTVSDDKQIDACIDTLTDARGRNIYVLLVHILTTRRQGNIHITLAYELLQPNDACRSQDDMGDIVSTACGRPLPQIK